MHVLLCYETGLLACHVLASISVPKTQNAIVVFFIFKYHEDGSTVTDAVIEKFGNTVIYHYNAFYLSKSIN